jgi:hypothetical protein
MPRPRGPVPPGPQPAAKPSVNLSVLPPSLLPADQRPALQRVFALSDRLLYLDGEGELAVDRRAMIELINDEAFPDGLRQIALVETAKHLGRRIRVPKKGVKPVSWLEAAKHGLPIAPASAKELRDFGLTKTTTPEEFGELFRARYPEIPDFWTATDPGELHAKVLEAFEANRTVWDCLVSNLGFWAALTIIGSLVVFFALLTLGWQVALACAIAYSGFVTAWVVLNCIVNVYFLAFH